MATSNASGEIYNHGMALDPDSKKVQCNYCGRVVAGFKCLEHHLSGIKGQAKECQEVPDETKKFFLNSLASVKEGDLVKDVGLSYQIGLSSKRKCNSMGEGEKRSKAECAQTDGSRDTQYMVSVELSSNDNDRLSFERTIPIRDGQPSLLSLAKKHVGSFLFENGIGFDAVATRSFQKMISFFANGLDVRHHSCSIRELKDSVLGHELNEIQNYVRDIRLSWPSTGCSILLDGWIDGTGRNLINIIVDCPLGPIYLRSVDISAAVKDVNALQLLLEGVIEEVGVHNVVQVITYITSEVMDTVGKQLVEKYKSLFWAVSATHCVALMLEKVGMLDSIKQIVNRAKKVTRFLYSHALLLELMRRHIDGYDLVKPSKIKAAMPFLTMENILIEKKNLQDMFTSVEWRNSPWASSSEGKRVADLVGDESFWDEVTFAVRAAIPLVTVLTLVNEDGKPSVGFIYETMDQVKETICAELGMKKAQYMPFWSIIDEIWNTVLHSPIHAAGYYLNPTFHYTDDFYSDSEVVAGLLITIVRMEEDRQKQDLISQQLNIFRSCGGDFKRGTQGKMQNKYSPAAWWSCFGGCCPDLQKLAIRVLSQTCNGAESYRLKRDLAERLLTSGRNAVEQQRLCDLTYVHYNLQLKHWKEDAKFDIEGVDIDPMDDWIVNKEEA